MVETPADRAAGRGVSAAELMIEKEDAPPRGREKERSGRHGEQSDNHRPFTTKFP